MSQPRRPRIGVDLASVVGRKSGLGHYVESVVRALEAVGSAHEFVEIRTIKRELRTPERIAWDQVGLPAAALAKRVDLLFVPAFSAPIFPRPVVMSAHDIYGLLYPESFAGFGRLYWQRVLPRSMRHATHLLCSSEHTRRDLIEHLAIPDSRLTVVPLAVDAEFRPLPRMEVEAQLRGLALEHPYVLAVGTLEPRKNLVRLVEAFAQLPDDGTRLVLVGKKFPGSEALFETIVRRRVGGRVIWLDYVSREQLVALYNGCRLFVMPSLYEGFGMPPLEAMNCGAAVAVSNSTSLPEVVGDAGALFDPIDVDSIRDTLARLLGDEAELSQLRARAPSQAARFSWERTARATLGVFDRVLGRA